MMLVCLVYLVYLVCFVAAREAPCLFISLYTGH
jgi:hypothetical protein